MRLDLELPFVRPAVTHGVACVMEVCGRVQVHLVGESHCAEKAIAFVSLGSCFMHADRRFPLTVERSPVLSWGRYS
jgi:hypothetical protein